MGLTPSQPGTARTLSYQVIDADYSRALDRLVIVSDNPAELHLIDPRAGSDTTVQLPLPPTAVSVSPNGMHAAVGHLGNVSDVDLRAARLVQRWPVSTDVLDLVVSDLGYAYVMPVADQWQPIRILNLSDGKETTTALNHQIYAGALVVLRPTADALYTADPLTPSSISEHLLLKPDQPTTERYFPSDNRDVHPPCEQLWLSEDGQRIFSRCGNVFRAAPADPQTDMTYYGTLPDLSAVRWAADSSVSHKVLALPETPDATYHTFVAAPTDARLHVYSAQSLALEHTIELPKLDDGRDSGTARGLYVFFDASGTHGVVVERAYKASMPAATFAIALIPI
ncbi:MAG TPA: hypothetical protein VF331_15405 [Polyangiales bacterium]